MALRIVIGIFAALRAVLIYGEAADLSTRQLHFPRLKPAPQPSHPPLAV